MVCEREEEKTRDHIFLYFAFFFSPVSLSASDSFRATAKFITAGSFVVPPSPVRFSLNSEKDRNAVKK